MRSKNMGPRPAEDKHDPTEAIGEILLEEAVSSVLDKIRDEVRAFDPEDRRTEYAMMQGLASECLYRLSHANLHREAAHALVEVSERQRRRHEGLPALEVVT